MSAILSAVLPALVQAGVGLYGSHRDRQAQRKMGASGGNFQNDFGSMKRPKGYDVFSTLNPQQASLLQQLLGSMSGQEGNISQNPLYQSGGNYLQKILSGDTEAFEAPLMRQFNERIIPGLAERFAGAGAGAQSSSAFQNALGSAGADLSERLGALRGGLQGQAAGQALGYAQQPVNNLQNLLSMNTQAFAPKQKSWLQEMLTGLSGGVGAGLGAGLTGGLSGASSLTDLLNSILSRKQQGSFIDQRGQITGPMY